MSVVIAVTRNDNDVIGDDDVSSDAAGDDDGSSDVTSTSDHMTMSFLMNKTPVRLELDKNEYIPHLPYYYTAEHGNIVQWTLDEQQVENTHYHTFIDFLQVKRLASVITHFID